MIGRTDPVRVGIIDDDESLCRSLARFLRASGLDSVTYGSAEALRADARRLRFDCFVLDVQLPGMSGIELRDLLAEEGVRAPVLFVTAYDDPNARTQALAGPCAGYFMKSDAGSELVHAIRGAVSATDR